MSASVTIFRKRLLSFSETFIADQGRFLPTFTPTFCGFHRDASGIDLLGDADSLLLEDFAGWTQVGKFRLRLGLTPHAGWLDALRQCGAALIHAHFLGDGVDAIRLGTLLSKPVVTTVHGHDITKRENNVAENRRRRLFFDRVDRVIAVSDFIAAQALARGCPEHKLTRHYIGIDIERFTQPREESPNPTVLFVGRLVEKKGCTYLLQAVQQLQSKFPDLRLTIVGEGSLAPSLRQEAFERGLEVEFTGAQNAVQIRQRLATSWLFVAPSIIANDGDAEGLGMVFLEAQALGTPVVSFRSGGVVEAVADGETGLLCEEKNVAELADNIATLLDNNALRHHMGEQGRARVERVFDIRKQCAALERIYREVS